MSARRYGTGTVYGDGPEREPASMDEVVARAMHMAGHREEAEHVREGRGADETGAAERGRAHGLTAAEVQAAEKMDMTLAVYASMRNVRNVEQFEAARKHLAAQRAAREGEEGDAR